MANLLENGLEAIIVILIAIEIVIGIITILEDLSFS